MSDDPRLTVRGLLRHVLARPLRHHGQAVPLGKHTERLSQVPVVGTDLLYNDSYYENIDPQKFELYHLLADVLVEHVGPETAVDLGCGSGIVLDRLHGHGVRVRGVEHSRAAIRRAPARVRESIVRADLRHGVPDLGPFDLGICIEVAEHLPHSAADGLVDGLCRADVICFTAATPGQTGTGHVNEQPHSYWKERFAARGRPEAPALEAAVREGIAGVPWPPWIHANLMLFARPGALGRPLR